MSFGQHANHSYAPRSVSSLTGEFDRAVLRKGELEGTKLAYLDLTELEASSIAI